MEVNVMLISKERARSELGDVSKSTLDRLLRLGELESVQVGRRRMITRESIVRFVDRRRLKFDEMTMPVDEPAAR